MRETAPAPGASRLSPCPTRPVPRLCGRISFKLPAALLTALCLLLAAAPAARGGGPSIWADMRAGLRFVLGWRALMLLALAYAVFQLFTPSSFIQVLVVALVTAAAVSTLGLIIGSVARL